MFRNDSLEVDWPRVATGWSLHGLAFFAPVVLSKKTCKKKNAIFVLDISIVGYVQSLLGINRGGFL